MFEKEAIEKANEKYPLPQVWNEIHLARNIKYQEGFQDGAEFGYKKGQSDQLVHKQYQLNQLRKANEWHKLDWEKDFPEADKLIRVRLRSGMEHICETCYYEPTEDEIGYGKLVISFYELNGEWVDDNDVLAWCYIEPFKENKQK